MSNLSSRGSSLKSLHSKTSISHPTHKLLPTIEEHREQKKISAKELTQAISKFNVVNKNQDFKNSERLIRCAVNVIKAFSMMENNFQELFQDLYQSIAHFTFAVDDEEIQNILNIYKLKRGCSMRNTCVDMDAQLQKIIKKNNLAYEQLKKQYQELMNNFNEHKAKWKKDKMQTQVEMERLRKLANTQYMESLENQVEQLKTRVSELQTQVKLLTKDNERFLNELDHNQQTIQDLKYQNAGLKADIHDLKGWQQKSEGYLNNMRDRFDGLLAKMVGIKQNIEKVEQQNENLVSERMTLIKRAAIGFEDLTPRPKYKQIFGIPVKRHLNSTKEIFAAIVQNSGMQYKDIVEKILLQPRNYKLEQTEAIRVQISHEILKAKHEMKKL